jgi:hypothetical protein
VTSVAGSEAGGRRTTLDLPSSCAAAALEGVVAALVLEATTTVGGCRSGGLASKSGSLEP